MTKGDIKTQFMGLMNRNDLRSNAALVSTFVDQSIIRIQRELRVPFMEKEIDFIVPSDFTTLTIPNDLLELVSIEVDSDNDGVYDTALRRVDRGTAGRFSQTVGVPAQVYARRAGVWVIGPTPAAGSHLLITYYAEFDELTDDTSSNTLTLLAWDAVLYGALSAACDYYADDRMQKFEGRYTQIMQSLQAQADADELTADAVVTPALLYDPEDF
jgi:hypothetical protein